MKILQLEYFITVVKQNSFTKAADLLHISQPSLTASIKKLEDELGYQLLTRTTKAVKITEKGTLFYHYATELVQQYHQTVEKMYDLSFSQTPKITISLLESTSQWMSTVIQQHRQQYDEQHYKVNEVLGLQDAVNMLLNYDAHIAITNEEIRHEDVTSIPLYEEEYFLLAPMGQFNTKSISIKDLPLILPNQHYQVRKHLDDYFVRLDVRPNIVMEVDRFEAATNFVHRGMGFAVIPRFYYQSYSTAHLDALRIRPKISRTIHLNYLKKRKHVARVLSLIELCQHYWMFE
ncbi:LysR family transcriptional regulator [Macrococcus equipercicus]|uniref:LysR family transcriptional regulator n=1 Tax=Macrococcus equipercicus TaxID=69967 RepID=A0ABQ6R7E2_9STAP|nr:LysR family transcriptional regulator [Macrococcus equipercicus]KAA1038375.1 LysR family transcriptional regulator [Macrococcus equipercicus]